MTNAEKYEHTVELGSEYDCYIFKHEQELTTKNFEQLCKHLGWNREMISLMDWRDGYELWVWLENDELIS
jgi:hypothetical protein